MKLTHARGLRSFTIVDCCLRLFAKASANDGFRSSGKPLSTPRSGLNNCQQPSTVRAAPAYTLIEVLAAAAIVSLGATAMVSLSATLMLQEEMANRVAVTRNYQECMVRMWQLGLSPVQVTALMPSQDQNAVLQVAIQGTPVLLQAGITNVPSSIGTFSMETARCTTVVNSSQDPKTEAAGATFSIIAHRPSLVTTLRPAPP